MRLAYWRTMAATVALGLLATIFVVAPATATAQPGGSRTYLVTVENLTAGQPLTPPVAATHRRSFDLFETGSSASPGVQQLAENGAVPALVNELEQSSHVGNIVVADANGPVLPGQAVTFEIVAEPGMRSLSIASMLICTNDGFTGLNNFALPSRSGVPVEQHLNSYDAGTEINTETFSDMVPPCGPLTGVDSGGQGTGTTDPSLAENGVIAAHGGIVGGADLVPAIHDWDDPAVKVTITRIDGAAQYEVTINNSTNGQPFTPPVLVTGSQAFNLYDVGSAASPAVQGLAENGNVPGVIAAATGAPGVYTVIAGDGPVLPGASATYTFYTQRNSRSLTFATMLICTNDGFTGVDQLSLPRHAGDSISADLSAYDAGTEINTETFSDMVPPCGPLTGVDSGGAGTGTTNPALAEGGVIGPHAGIVGDSDLVEAIHNWDGFVGEITVTRTQ